MAEGEIDNLTMEQYLALTQGNHAPGVVKPEIGGNVNFKIKSQFMQELGEDTFSWNKNDDAHEHVERVLDIVTAKRSVDILSLGTVDSWDLLKKPLSKGTIRHPKPLSSLKKSVTSSRKTMADHSQKWNDDSSSRNIDSSSNTEGIVAIVSKLDNLGRDMKKLKENVHASQVGCQLCGGAHLDKECPLNEGVKSVEEVKYSEFRRSSPFSNGAKYCVGPPGYYTRVDNRPPFEEKRPSLEELLNKHLKKSTQRRAKMEE
ncbi:zinc knuckle CX2CX4HX4C containing protein [Tanacetum coccineum]